jgi:glutamyl-tRNA synthetase
MSANHSIVARLAPSPTGALHLGNARSFLIAWLSARSQGGRILLRIEDIDSPRVKPESVQQIFDDFQWLGLDWDEGPYAQTARLPLYEAALDDLKRRELVYPCTCTRNDIERAASAPHQEHEGPVYPGTCRFRSAADADNLGDRPFAWRVRADSTRFAWEDGFRGAQSLDSGGDFVIWKSSTQHSPATPAYQLAVVVDDAAMSVSEVVRGDDLVRSTPRQLLLYQLLGWTAPRFYHVPLVVGPDGRRLAKRHGDTRVSTFRNGGMSAESLLGWLAWTCGWLPRGESVKIADLVPLFRWDTIPHQPWTLSRDAGPP